MRREDRMDPHTETPCGDPDRRSRHWLLTGEPKAIFRPGEEECDRS